MFARFGKAFGRFLAWRGSGYLALALLAALGGALARHYYVVSELSECRRSFDGLEKQQAEADLQRERRQRRADAIARAIDDSGDEDIEQIRSTEDPCGGLPNPDADLLRDKANRINERAGN